jgi:hypothetical protein
MLLVFGGCDFIRITSLRVNPVFYVTNDVLAVYDAYGRTMCTGTG